MGLKRSSPWVEYYRYIEAIFGKDPDIKVVFDEEAICVRLLVNNNDKAEALKQILPASENFGGVELIISVIPCNDKESKEQLLKRAFDGNPAVDDVVAIDGGAFPTPFTYVIFKKEVVQFWNDNLGDPRGMETTLYEEIARKLFNQQDGVLYCTNIE